MKLAFIVPRYGKDVVGGAETLSRGLAEHLPRETYNVEILTTCAKSHFTWENHYPDGVIKHNGIDVRRFKVNNRDIGAFIDVQRKIEEGLSPAIEEQLLWAKESVNSDALYDYIWKKGKDYDYLIFLPYLFGTTFWGAQIYPERSLLIPCLHDEVYARLDIFRILFEKVKGIIFNSEPERVLAIRRFSLNGKATAVVGMGFETDEPESGSGYDASRFRKRLGIADDYILYFGRKEGGKNLPLLLDYFCSFKKEKGSRLKLMVAGDGEMNIPQNMKHEIIDLGFLSEGDKRDAAAGAVFVCQPSVNESFSIVIMEAWLTGTPVLVHGDCDVTRWHVTESNGGLYFKDYYGFSEALEYLLKDSRIRNTLGSQGKSYVRENYSWPVVIKRFDKALEACQ